jgi:CTP:molybdopterin cytidylyltransferase MocA
VNAITPVVRRPPRASGLVPARLIPAVMSRNKPGGLKTLLAGEHNSRSIVAPDAIVLFEVDSPEDCARLLT